MPGESHTESVTKAVKLSVRDDVRALIDRAARAQGRSRSDFMIEASRRAAEEALMDQILISVSGDIYHPLIDVLDGEPESNARLRKTLRTSPPWEAA